MVIYHCEDSMEGIFTAIYQAYEEKQKPQETLLSLTEETMLFAECKSVTPDAEKTAKVVRTLRRRFGEADFEQLAFALSSFQKEKAQAVYQTIARGLRERPAPGHLLDALGDPYVRDATRFARSVDRENSHFMGFTRFEELENGVLYGVIAPKNDLLTLLMPHFADRFPQENFMLYDRGRALLGIHPAGREWCLAQGYEKEAQAYAGMEKSADEVPYQELFRCFCHKIAIPERENRALQKNLLPLRFREDMVEFTG